MSNIDGICGDSVGMPKPWVDHHHSNFEKASILKHFSNTQIQGNGVAAKDGCVRLYNAIRIAKFLSISSADIALVVIDN